MQHRNEPSCCDGDQRCGINAILSIPTPASPSSMIFYILGHHGDISTTNDIVLVGIKEDPSITSSTNDGLKWHDVDVLINMKLLNELY
jgi:hypothetical protein